MEATMPQAGTGSPGAAGAAGEIVIELNTNTNANANTDVGGGDVADVPLSLSASTTPTRSPKSGRESAPESPLPFFSGGGDGEAYLTVGGADADLIRAGGSVTGSITTSSTGAAADAQSGEKKNLLFVE